MGPHKDQMKTRRRRTAQSVSRFWSDFPEILSVVCPLSGFSVRCLSGFCLSRFCPLSGFCPDFRKKSCPFTVLVRRRLDQRLKRSSFAKNGHFGPRKILDQKILLMKIKSDFIWTSNLKLKFSLAFNWDYKIKLKIMVFDLKCRIEFLLVFLKSRILY